MAIIATNAVTCVVRVTGSPRPARSLQVVSGSWVGGGVAAAAAPSDPHPAAWRDGLVAHPRPTMFLGVAEGTTVPRC